METMKIADGSDDRQIPLIPVMASLVLTVSTKIPIEWRRQRRFISSMYIFFASLPSHYHFFSPLIFPACGKIEPPLNDRAQDAGDAGDAGDAINLTGLLQG